MQQISVKAISPIVIGADEPSAIAFFSCDKFVATVPAYIIKSVYLSVFCPLKKKGPRSDF
jgi:hypothetical protein